jgi:alkanesulfonate monooxygenase SsuD/methylene tetrahydromethanopterin reductase-like flavin-dependent oxidoreductase (luciferase family)
MTAAAAPCDDRRNDKKWRDTSMLQIGLTLTLEWTADEDDGTQLRQILEQARAARDAGFHSLWVTQHLVVGPTMRQFQPMPLLGRLSEAAPGLTLGTGVLLLSMLNPVLLAEECATLDRFTEGRFILGVGIGYREHEFKSMGVPMSQRVSRMVEYIEVMRRLWTEDRVTHHGKYVNLDDVGIGTRPRDGKSVPIWIGGTVPAAVKRAGELGDSWSSAGAFHIDELKQFWGIFHDARIAAGKSADYPRQIARECYVGPDGVDAMETVRGPITGKYSRYAGYGFGGFDETAGNPNDAFAAFAKDRFIIGDSAHVKDELHRFKEEVGGTGFRFRMQWPGLSHADTLASIGRLGKIAASM